jgi:hypothetical protein
MHALQCRQHAEDCRHLAETAPYIGLRGPFLALAETWDSVARDREVERGELQGPDGSILTEGVVRTLRRGRLHPRKRQQGSGLAGGRTRRQRATA